MEEGTGEVQLECHIHDIIASLPPGPAVPVHCHGRGVVVCSTVVALTEVTDTEEGTGQLRGFLSTGARS